MINPAPTHNKFKYQKIISSHVSTTNWISYNKHTQEFNIIWIPYNKYVQIFNIIRNLTIFSF